MEARWKGVSLPCPVFSKGQRVTRTAIVENKSLGDAPAIVRAQQYTGLRTKVLTNSETTEGHQRRLMLCTRPRSL